MRSSLAAALAGACLLTAPAGIAQPAASAPAPAQLVAARVIVQFRADSPLLRAQVQSAATPGSRAALLAQRLGTPLRSAGGFAGRMQVLQADGMRSEQLAARLRAQPEIEFAVPDERRRLHAAPNDPRYLRVPQPPGPVAGQWYLRAPDATVRSSIDVEPAWEVTRGSSQVVVAVLDTGVRYDHADLPGLLPGYDMISDVATANDGDGRDGDATDPGDFISNAEHRQSGGAFEGCGASDSSWHGTHMAGLIAAATDNGLGMASVGRGVRLLPVRVLGKCGGFDSDIIAGMRWAAGLPVPGVPTNPHPAKVINLSLGSAGACTDAYRAAIEEIRSTGAVIVSSAGNSAGHAVSTPANCPGVVAIGGLRHAGTKVGFSDLGPEIALSAPGGNCVDVEPGAPCRFPILTTTNAGRTTAIAGSSAYTDSSNASVGTSYAAPLVAGTVGLMLSVHPGLLPDEIRRRLQQGTRPFPTSGADNGSDPAPVGICQPPQFDGNGRPVDQAQCYCTTATCGAGMLDAGAALRLALLPQAAFSQSGAFAIAGETLRLSAAPSSAALGRSVQRTRFEVVDGGGIVAPASADAATLDLMPSAAGRFVVALRVTDSAGATSVSSRSIEVYAPGTAPNTAGGGGGGGALDAPWLAGLLLAVLALRRSRRPAAGFSSRGRCAPARRT